MFGWICAVAGFAWLVWWTMSVQSSLSSTSDRLTYIGKTLDGIDKTLSDIRFGKTSDISDKLTSIDKDLEFIDKTLEGIDKTMDRLHSSVSDDLASIDKTLTDINSEVADKLNELIGTVDKGLDALGDRLEQS